MNKVHLHTTERSETIIAWALLFTAGAVIALLLTFGGLHWLYEQVVATQNIKSSIVTAILGLGLVFIGPVLLLALAAVLPRWWFRAIKTAVRKMFVHSSQ